MGEKSNYYLFSKPETKKKKFSVKNFPLTSVLRLGYPPNFYAINHKHTANHCNYFVSFQFLYAHTGIYRYVYAYYTYMHTYMCVIIIDIYYVYISTL